MNDRFVEWGLFRAVHCEIMPCEKCAHGKDGCALRQFSTLGLLPVKHLTRQDWARYRALKRTTKDNLDRQPTKSDNDEEIKG